MKIDKQTKKMKIIRIFLFVIVLVLASCKEEIAPETMIKERVATMTKMAELGTVE